MVFTTPCWRSVAERLRAIVCVLVVLGCATLAQAGSIEPKKASLATAEDGSTVLNAEFAIDLGPRLEEAVSRGVPLYFALELEVTRPRWWWSNEVSVSRSQKYRLSYTALTRQYRLTTDNLHRNFATLGEALRVMSRFVDLPAADKGALRNGESYEVSLRFALDRNQLPKPLQVDALADRDWQLDARVLHWRYVPTPYAAPPVAPPAPPPAAGPEARL